MTESLTTSAVIELSACVVSVESAVSLPDTFDAPLIEHVVILEPAAETVTGAGGVPVDGAVNVQPAMDNVAVPANAGTALSATNAVAQAATAASRAGRSMASPLSR
ncbi:hypothetical protein [Conexibacter woesei]|uniref:hypothetical protein n=1 Tax=Conexibacter woesei TaxID=191495 RepID=UPI000322C672|nr:hypothetical protein [Conexibacter woesei]